MRKQILTITILLLSIISYSQIDSTYYYNSKKVLEKFPKSRITAEDLYISAVETYDKQGIIVPYKLAISQAIIETSLGNTGVGLTRNNPFSINSKKGYIKYDNITDGTKAYYLYISLNYLKCKSIVDLMKKFKNCNNKRYASDPKYENRLRKIYKKL